MAAYLVAILFYFQVYTFFAPLYRYFHKTIRESNYV
jgi:hypothetical protein